MPKYRQFFLMNCVKESGGHMSTLNIDIFLVTNKVFVIVGGSGGYFKKKNHILV